MLSLGTTAIIVTGILSTHLTKFNVNAVPILPTTANYTLAIAEVKTGKEPIQASLQVNIPPYLTHEHLPGPLNPSRDQEAPLVPAKREETNKRKIRLPRKEMVPLPPSPQEFVKRLDQHEPNLSAPHFRHGPVVIDHDKLKSEYEQKQEQEQKQKEKEEREQNHKEAHKYDNEQKGEQDQIKRPEILHARYTTEDNIENNNDNNINNLIQMPSGDLPPIQYGGKVIVED